MLPTQHSIPNKVGKKRNEACDPPQVWKCRNKKISKPREIVSIRGRKKQGAKSCAGHAERDGQVKER